VKKMNKKKALLVGINDYEQISDLRGCHNDVTNVRNILKQYFGFTNKDIRVLLDSRATRENVLARMEWLSEGMKKGDKIFFHFSGHGSQIRDRDGDELRDHMDEILCMWGMSWDKGYIIDDEFDNWLNSISSDVIVEVLFDCCHSGTGASINPVQRSRAVGKRDEVDADIIGRFLPPPFDIELRSEGEDLLLKRFVNAAIPVMLEGLRENTLSRPVPKRYIWSGCGEAQTSADAYIGGSFNGAFSYYWCKHVRETSGKVKRHELLAKVRSSLRFNGYIQIPELTCSEPFAWLPIMDTA
jgi:metacaspase-1